ncbi:unnamed protein product [Alopecurus aequalis]
MDATHGDDAAAVHLPHDVLLEILRRLPHRALVQSRRVCRAWRATVDDSALLLTHFRRLFPRRDFPGVFTSNDDDECDVESSFFAPATGKPRRGADDGDDEHGFRYPPFAYGWAAVEDHCNGLLLLHAKEGHSYYYVCNPATVRCARLQLPPQWDYCNSGMFLAFDPAVSRHHEVFMFPQVMKQLRPEKPAVRRDVKVERSWTDISTEHLRSFRLFEEDQPFDQEEEQCEVLQQPQEQLFDESAVEAPKDEVLSLLVFSSRTNKWECREFVPGRCAPKHLSGVLINSRFHNFQRIWKSAEYWRGSLYVHCHKNILMILRSLQETYDMVQLPRIPCDEEEFTAGIHDLPTRSVLANYEKGIRYVALNTFQLHVWALNEPTDGQLAWTLTHQADLSPYNHRINHKSLPTQSMVPWNAVKSKKHTLTLFEPLSEDFQST